MFRIRRAATVIATVGAALAMSAGSASAHHCFVPMYSLSAPTSANWFTLSAEQGAGMFFGYQAECDGAVEAGYDALRADGQPVAIKIFEKMTIGDPKHTGRMNPNGADGKGLEYFGAGSSVPDLMVQTWVAGAESYECHNL